MLKGSGTIVMLLLSSLLIQGTPGEGCCYPTISKGRKPNWTTTTGTARPASAAASNCKNSTFMSLRVCVCVICYLYVWHCMYVCMFVYVLNCVLFSNLFRALLLSANCHYCQEYSTVQGGLSVQYYTPPASLPPALLTNSLPQVKRLYIMQYNRPSEMNSHKW